jgi:hypothetical protein
MVKHYTYTLPDVIELKPCFSETLHDMHQNKACSNRRLGQQCKQIQLVFLNIMLFLEKERYEILITRVALEPARNMPLF